ncbi:MAG: amidohydrolase/deacetylase family metallohydrolase [Myxococcota bacterium]
MREQAANGATLIRGGTLIDVEANRVERGDVLVRNGVVARVGRIGAASASQYDARDCYVCPGFIDIHTHVFSPDPARPSRLEADRIGVHQGVACLVDAGSAGAKTIDLFPEHVHKRQVTPTFALINIGSPGLADLRGGHTSRPELLSLPGVVSAFERHGDWLLAVKVLASASHAGSFGLEAVKIARKAAELVGRPLMVHIGNAPPVVDEVLGLLRRGDIVTHTYHGKVGGVLGHRRTVIRAFRDAVARGAIVDVGHGRASFSYRTCEQALTQRMPVHTISSDLHRGNVERPVVSLARTMTKLLALGMSLLDVVCAVTLTPARALGLDERGFGTLAEGRPAHISVFRLREEPVELEDAEGEVRTAARWIEPRAVFVHGERHDCTAPV